MRLLSGLMLLLPLMSPLAHAELIDDVNDRGELRIALDAASPPWSFKQDGQLTGFDVELGELLANELEVHASLLVTDHNELLSGVESGKYDVAINHIALTPELQNRFDFSQPYDNLRTPVTGVAQASSFVEPANQARTLTEIKLAIPFQKGNPAFQKSLNNALQRIRDDGRLAALAQKWQVVEK